MLIGQKVTVLGAGIGGLAVATALALRGASVTVLEQAEAIREVGAGLQISPNGVAVLRALGLEQELAKRAVRGQAVSLRDYRKSREVARLDLAKAAGSYYFVHRADLVEILAKAARDAGVKIRLLQKISQVEMRDCGACLTTAQGARLGADLLIGADGLHSVARRVLNGSADPFFTRQVAWRAVVPAMGDEPAEATVHMGPGGHLVSYPLRGGTAINIVAVQERIAWADEGWFHQDDPDNLRSAFARFAAPVQELLNRVEDVHLWGLFRHPVAPVWHKGAVAILGDAAHPTLPFMAQGANMALEDAWVLAAALATHPDRDVALAFYQQARRARCEQVVEAANRNARNYHLSFPPLRLAAHTALRAGSKMAPEKLLGRFDWIYRHDVTALYP